MKNNKGFTLIEMLIVLAVISILLLLFIPNLANKSKNLNEQGCDALMQLVENQLISYELDEGQKPDTLDELEENDYVESLTCNGGNTKIVYNPAKNGLEQKNVQ
ncbi:competence type IV pilus major pilin ComGC [Gracilibacillus sp. S3-1-1]|uniref:Competence type IV pilus major pilin ComGC n=1 Tax=Gracilibacillus pellucidus TaxID=3095368 RepID=A0ACC6M4V6_9BACI|nr:competence type IV pilus major pilin ComGC [Gracilibacillus sp. S3-1-1]MDX8046000.1 competence type IV pilus major pilin ComGC [Gracilibacillus sp. S3-1-1]